LFEANTSIAGFFSEKAFSFISFVFFFSSPSFIAASPISRIFSLIFLTPKSIFSMSDFTFSILIF
jgi:hypothetical protein